MDLQLTEEQTLIVDMVRRFVREEILPREMHLDPDADELPVEDKAALVEKTKAMGLYGLDIPVEYGGPDIDLSEDGDDLDSSDSSLEDSGMVDLGKL